MEETVPRQPASRRVHRLALRRPGSRTGHRSNSHIGVPGKSETRSDVDGLTYGAHIWCSGDSCLLCVEIFC